MKIRRVLTGRAYRLTLSLLAFLAFAGFANAFAKTPETKPAAATSNGKLLGIDRRTPGR